MSWVLPVIAVLGVLGTVGTAVVLFIKVGPERASIEIANVDQIIVREREYSDRLAKRVDEAEGKIGGLADQVAGLTSALGVVTAERDRLRNENQRLRERVEQLELHVEQLRNGHLPQ